MGSWIPNQTIMDISKFRFLKNYFSMASCMKEWMSHFYAATGVNRIWTCLPLGSLTKRDITWVGNQTNECSDRCFVSGLEQSVPLCFPPLCLVGRTLKKAQKHLFQMIIITPAWVSQVLKFWAEVCESCDTCLCLSVWEVLREVMWSEIWNHVAVFIPVGYQKRCNIIGFLIIKCLSLWVCMDVPKIPAGSRNFGNVGCVLFVSRTVM